jgi:hypothetical protein
MQRVLVASAPGKQELCDFTGRQRCHLDLRVSQRILTRLPLKNPLAAFVGVYAPPAFSDWNDIFESRFRYACWLHGAGHQAGALAAGGCFCRFRGVGTAWIRNACAHATNHELAASGARHSGRDSVSAPHAAGQRGLRARHVRQIATCLEWDEQRRLWGQLLAQSN